VKSTKAFWHSESAGRGSLPGC